MTELRLRMAPALLAFLFATPALPRGPRAQDLAGADLEPVEVRPAAAWQARLFERLRSRGRGGGVAELFTAQTRYAAEHGENAVLVCWEETVPQGPGGVDLIVDSQVAAHIDALPALWLPDCQCRLVTGLRENGPVPGGDFDGDGTPEDEELLHSFEVVGPDGHIGVQVQKVRDSQFFGDAREVTCGFIGASCADEEDDCEIEVGGNGGALLPVNDRGTGAGRREHSRLGGRRGRDPDRRGDRVAGPARRPLGCSVSL